MNKYPESLNVTLNHFVSSEPAFLFLLSFSYVSRPFTLTLFGRAILWSILSVFTSCLVLIFSYWCWLSSVSLINFPCCCIISAMFNLVQNASADNSIASFSNSLAVQPKYIPIHIYLWIGSARPASADFLLAQNSNPNKVLVLFLPSPWHFLNKARYISSGLLITIHWLKPRQQKYCSMWYRFSC